MWQNWIFSLKFITWDPAFWKLSSFFYNPLMLLFILTSFFLPFKSFLVCICPVIPIPWPKATYMSNTLVHLNCLSCQQRPVQGKAQKHRGWGAERKQRDCAQRHGMATIQHPSSLPAGHHPGWHRSDASSCPACPQWQLRMLERGRLPSVDLQSLEEKWMWCFLPPWNKSFYLKSKAGQVTVPKTKLFGL